MVAATARRRPCRYHRLSQTTQWPPQFVRVVRGGMKERWNDKNSWVKNVADCECRLGINTSPLCPPRSERCVDRIVACTCVCVTRRDAAGRGTGVACEGWFHRHSGRHGGCGGAWGGDVRGDAATSTVSTLVTCLRGRKVTRDVPQARHTGPHRTPNYKLHIEGFARNGRWRQPLCALTQSASAPRASFCICIFDRGTISLR